MGSPMYHLFDKIKHCRMALVGWSRTLGNSKKKIEEKHKEPEALSSMNMAETLELIQKVRDEINSLLFQDELFWRQRSWSLRPIIKRLPGTITGISKTVTLN